MLQKSKHRNMNIKNVNITPWAMIVNMNDTMKIKTLILLDFFGMFPHFPLP